MTAQQFKDVFALHPGGVAIALWNDGPAVRGLTLTSVVSVSADPPLLTFSVASVSRRLSSLRAAQRLSVAFPAADQVDLVRWFASPAAAHAGPSERIEVTGDGTPVLQDARAVLLATVAGEVPVGSSVMFVAEIDAVRPGRDAAPLVYHRRQFTTVTTRADPAAVEGP